jgi:hypothetical protein
MVTEKVFSEEQPCGVEGCGRSTLPYGDDVRCGLSKLFRYEDTPEHLKRLCSSEILVDNWLKEGLFDGITAQITDRIINEINLPPT